MAQLLKYSAITRRAGLDRIDSKKRPVPPAHSCHSQLHCHDLFLSLIYHQFP
jgi:hypothetical protein